MKCSNCFNCSGKMVIKNPETKGPVWVSGSDLPAFAQCDMCGVVPPRKQQPEVVKRLLEEVMLYGDYTRDTTYLSGRPVMNPVKPPKTPRKRQTT